jgi:hypothetical protein
MGIKSAFAATTMACFLAHSAGAQTWLPPKEIQPKTDTGGAATSAQTSAPGATAAKSSDPAKGVSAPKGADASKAKEAKLKDCKAQSLAKGLHGAERKKFLDSCKNP